MNKRKIFLASILLFLLAAIGGIFYLNRENRQLKTEILGLKQDPQKIDKEEIAKVIELVSKLVVLPEGEEPVMATVTDKEKLKDQTVFAKAENGDKILIYIKAQKAYIYRPSSNKLIDVVPVNMGDQQVRITGVDESNPLKIALANGSRRVGITNELEKRLSDKNIPGLSVVSKFTAMSNEYIKTQVIDVSGKRQLQAMEVALLVGGEVATQSAEANLEADILVILGADFK